MNIFQDSTILWYYNYTDCIWIWKNDLWKCILKKEEEKFFNTLSYYGGTYYDNENLIEKVN